MRPARQADPFSVLGLPASRGLTDDEVRAAWRRIAAATHPDRADGGDTARFARRRLSHPILDRQPDDKGISPKRPGSDCPTGTMIG